MVNGLSLSERTPLSFRLGIYDPGREDEAEFFGPIFEPCQLDTLAMKLTIDRFKVRNEPDFRIGIFIVEEVKPCRSAS